MPLTLKKFNKKPQELCFTANTANSTVTLNQYGSPYSVTLQTSTDGSNWSTYTIGTTITLTNIGDKVYFRNSSTTTTGFSKSSSAKYRFVMSGSINSSGDVSYLLNRNGTTILSSTQDYCFYELFYNCGSLKTPPRIPLTTLATYCYGYMFKQSGLTTPPVLPATTLAGNCYYCMFANCSSLTTPPSLPATTLAPRCYSMMYEYCTGLTSINNLPAITLTEGCYNQMYSQCSKIHISTTQSGTYPTPYRIPTTGTGTTASSALGSMFNKTGGPYRDTPSINTTYYTSNTVV